MSSGREDKGEGGERGGALCCPEKEVGQEEGQEEGGGERGRWRGMAGRAPAASASG